MLELKNNEPECNASNTYMTSNKGRVSLRRLPCQV